MVIKRLEELESVGSELPILYFLIPHVKKHVNNRR